MSINFNYNYPQLAREAGFRLRQYKDGPIDWRVLGALETERLLQDQRIEQIDAVLTHLSEAPLASLLDTNILDSGIAKYFVVSQFAVQYLLFCRKFLDETVRELREAHAESQLEVAKLRKSLAEANNEILTLHKKITQIEAIHEVVYPCHLCSKSFISNEALNIHISRRHAAARGNASIAAIATGNLAVERHMETPVTGGTGGVGTKEREHSDINLINTIKLELEIKQLKERLNNAERDIRERGSTNTKGTTSRERECGQERQREREQERERERGPEHGQPKREYETVDEGKHKREDEHESEGKHKQNSQPREKILKSVAIQSELLETKEQDDTTVTEDSLELRDRKEQLTKLQQRIHDFEEWRAAQQVNNEESIAEINKKLAEIVQTLEDTKTKQLSSDAVKTAQSTQALQRRISPSVDNLEQMLTQKVVEIGQKSAEKLEEFVHNMEANYKEKLQELEREIEKKRIEIQRTTTPQSGNSTDSHTPEPIATTQKDVIRTRVKRDAELKMQRSNTFDIMDSTKQKTIKGPAPRPRTHTQPATLERDVVASGEPYSLSVESNRTFVKAEQQNVASMKEVLEPKAPTAATQNDSTDVTESLDSESDSTTSSKAEAEAKTEKIQPHLEQSQTSKEKPLDSQKGSDNSTKLPHKKQRAPPKPCTRKEAQRIVNKYFAAHGVEAKSKSISTATMKRLHAELTERRNKLKQKQPHFYATRSKIKKLVDKLCSTKLPKPVAIMLKTTAPLQPLQNFHGERPLQDTQLSASDVESFEALEATSTPLQTPQSTRENSDAFKQRLERILASPVRQPSDDAAEGMHNIVAAAQVHKVALAPVPLARKRVMFSTRSSANLDNSTDGVTGSGQ